MRAEVLASALLTPLKRCQEEASTLAPDSCEEVKRRRACS